MIKRMYFQPSGWIPNNPELPVLIYQQVFREHPNEIKTVFTLNNWRNSWKDTIFNYTHYHSTAHEVLGVISGHAKLMLGGENGQMVHVKAGDVLLLPGGTGHRKISASESFQVIGAYPDGMEYDVLTEKETFFTKAVASIERIPLPTLDPVYGHKGPVPLYWKD
ncbi:cupin domain-containing protein [Paenisporosarcina cavernae]|uniref:Cupin domain-containing protein n=1 Tax=Paenisporosarcina cavernae TaxID=2320858 RepID=A0A385YPD6_9BACL|nr:cupin domain-containing protein [Paenisporosarcina cavernae]AYC28565.1 cupin domain-containing protein [Paenisporosarcina cavernae]